MATLDELLEWLWKGGEIGIFDATNSTRLRRNAVVQRAAEAGERYGTTVAVVFIESICEDRAVLEANTFGVGGSQGGRQSGGCASIEGSECCRASGWGKGGSASTGGGAGGRAGRGG